MAIQSKIVEADSSLLGSEETMFIHTRNRLSACLLLGTSIAISWFSASACATEDEQTHLARNLEPILACLSGQHETFTLTAKIDTKIKGSPQRIDVRLTRSSDDSFDLDIMHHDYAIQLRRRGKLTAMVLPLHKKVFLGRGTTDPNDHLAPLDISNRLISSASNLAIYVPILQSGEPNSVALLLATLLKVRFDPNTSAWDIAGKASCQFGDQGKTITLYAGETRVQLALSSDAAKAEPIGNWTEMQVIDLERKEIEQQLVRGVRRASEVLAPAPQLLSPTQTAKKVDHGELRWIEGNRVALLYGTPEQIGKAHGELLSQEAMRCIDSVLCTFGTLQTIRSGRWFRHELADAYAKLAPHIPERHKAETRAMAASLGIDEALAQTLNVFPELFHCSGFAVFGTATIDGKLYHGRVLDYMTAIGLQDAATTFIVAPEGQNAFANIGYAGFIGSVSGMNEQAISLGEMGGHREGQWEGVPMATLMRRALEECSTLDDVMTLWTNSPRTCEYFYVFADGKTNRAVGVAATPESLEYVRPGQAHEMLGPGIKDAVVLSAGSRLEKLRERVTRRHGQIDADVAKWLMSRPVAMQSNLHNVLFVPSDGVMYVANATHNQPAAERPYVRFDLRALLDAMPRAIDEKGPVTANN